MRFSFWPSSAHPWSEILDSSRRAEASGYDGIWFADHFMPNGADNGGPCQECFTVLAGLAAAVPRVRLGTLVVGNTYRHPAVVAKMAATIDHLSGGRFVLGLGAGWQENEHKAYGIPFYTMPDRLQRLEEACRVVRALLRDERSSFEGKYYTLDDAPLAPKPVQQPLPIMIGGGGEKVTLRITARHAEEWNVWGTVETLVHKMKVLDHHCEREGRDPAMIQRSAVALLVLSDDRAKVEQARANAGRPPVVAGDVSEVRDIMARYREAGVDEFILPDFNLGKGAQKQETMDRFIREVAADLR
jgi:F420-dependent oxidoreductase-like protein